MEILIEKLTDYTIALKEALESTNEANERPLLTSHLAAAAKMYALLYRERDVHSIEEIVKAEIHSHGWSAISGQAGENVANTWVAFTEETGIEY
jgi:hypothetical protein